MSKVYIHISKKPLIMGVPKDYLILIMLIVSGSYLITWFGLHLTGYINAFVAYFIQIIVFLLSWGFGLIKAKTDPEFLSVHVARFSIPVDKQKDIGFRVKRYKEKQEIEP